MSEGSSSFGFGGALIWIPSRRPTIAHAVTNGAAQPRPVDSPWQDKPSAFAARKAAQ